MQRENLQIDNGGDDGERRRIALLHEALDRAEDLNAALEWAEEAERFIIEGVVFTIPIGAPYPLTERLAQAADVRLDDPQPANDDADPIDDDDPDFAEVDAADDEQGDDADPQVPQVPNSGPLSGQVDGPGYTPSQEDDESDPEPSEATPKPATEAVGSYGLTATEERDLIRAYVAGDDFAVLEDQFGLGKDRIRSLTTSRLAVRREIEKELGTTRMQAVSGQAVELPDLDAEEPGPVDDEDDEEDPADPEPMRPVSMPKGVKSIDSAFDWLKFVAKIDVAQTGVGIFRIGDDAGLTAKQVIKYANNLRIREGKSPFPMENVGFDAGPGGSSLGGRF